MKKSEARIFNFFNEFTSIKDIIDILTIMHEDDDADRNNIKSDCEHFLTMLIENKILIEEIT